MTATPRNPPINFVAILTFLNMTNFLPRSNALHHGPDGCRGLLADQQLPHPDPSTPQTGWVA
jgi:hypothetical protein